MSPANEPQQGREAAASCLGTLLCRQVDAIADRLRCAAQAAQAAEGLAAEGRNAESLELLVEQMLPLRDALTHIELLALKAVAVAFAPERGG